MHDLGYLLFGVVDGLVLASVFAGLTWAAIQDGRDERAFKARTVTRHATLAPGAMPAAA